MTIQQNTSVFDLANLLDGSLDNILELMNTYSIESFDTDLTAKVIKEVYNTKSNIVNTFFINDRKLVTSDILPIEFSEFYYAEFSNEFSDDFKSIKK